jgi:hypothetical protein
VKRPNGVKEDQAFKNEEIKTPAGVKGWKCRNAEWVLRKTRLLTWGKGTGRNQSCRQVWMGEKAEWG